MKICTALFILPIILIGNACGKSPVPISGVRMDIAVYNATSKHIYVVVNSGSRHEDFGVVGKGTTATIGFGVTPIGQTVTIDWSVGHPDAVKQTATLAFPVPVNDMVTLTYQEDGTWTTVPPVLKRP